MSSKRKIRLGQLVTPLYSVTPVITTQTASDKFNQYVDACEQIRKFHAKWNSLRFPEYGERDAQKVANFEQRVREYVKSARIAKRDAETFSAANPRIQACIARNKQYN